MSAYSDWKCGAMTDEEFRSHAAWEARVDEGRYYDMIEAYLGDDAEDEEDE